jgi:multisubunit Na+/H+ antiporter MnhB subunit
MEAEFGEFLQLLYCYFWVIFLIAYAKEDKKNRRRKKMTDGYGIIFAIVLVILVLYLLFYGENTYEQLRDWYRRIKFEKT